VTEGIIHYCKKGIDRDDRPKDANTAESLKMQRTLGMRRTPWTKGKTNRTNTTGTNTIAPSLGIKKACVGKRQDEQSRSGSKQEAEAGKIM
jgi:hypothetical protein